MSSKEEEESNDSSTTPSSNKDISHEKVKQVGVHNRQNTDTYGASRE